VAVRTDPMGNVATVEADVHRLGSRPIVLALLTYNNAATAPTIAQTGYRGLSRSFPDVPLAIVNADAGSSDGTTERLPALGLPHTAGASRISAEWAHRRAVPRRARTGPRAPARASDDAAAWRARDRPARGRRDLRHRGLARTSRPSRVGRRG